MDVDGVLTDGKVYDFIDVDGRFVELKGVDTQDGLGLSWLIGSGISTGVISGRESMGLKKQLEQLGMRYIVQGKVEKIPSFEAILKKARVGVDQTAYIGDDLTDLPSLKRVGWAIAPANARPEVKRAAHTVTRAKGGQGAVREVCETLLRAQGRWKTIFEGYSKA